jgi:hypothetical protein
MPGVTETQGHLVARTLGLLMLRTPTTNIIDHISSVFKTKVSVKIILYNQHYHCLGNKTRLQWQRVHWGKVMLQV